MFTVSSSGRCRCTHNTVNQKFSGCQWESVPTTDQLELWWLNKVCLNLIILFSPLNCRVIQWFPHCTLIVNVYTLTLKQLMPTIRPVACPGCFLKFAGHISTPKIRLCLFYKISFSLSLSHHRQKGWDSMVQYNDRWVPIPHVSRFLSIVILQVLQCVITVLLYSFFFSMRSWEEVESYTFIGYIMSHISKTFFFHA